MKRNHKALYLATLSLIFTLSFTQMRILAEVSGSERYVYAAIPAVCMALLCNVVAVGFAFGYDEAEMIPNVVLEAMQ